MKVALPLSPPVFAILSSLIQGETGLSYGQETRELLAEKVSVCAEEAGFDSLLDYYYFLRYDPEGKRAFEQLVDSLLVHETYFFREVEQLRALVDTILAPKIRAGGRVRVWSAACATGEEPLTLAMLLAERALLEQVDILASDLSQRAIDRAQRGDHGFRALRALPAGVEGRYLDLVDGRPVVRATLRRNIEWRRVNLVDRAQVAALGTFDAILCRNVLIYFGDETVVDVVEGLTAALRPGGQLVVGTSESLMRFGTRLECQEHGGAFFYSRAGP